MMMACGVDGWGVAMVTIRGMWTNHVPVGASPLLLSCNAACLHKHCSPVVANHSRCLVASPPAPAAPGSTSQTGTAPAGGGWASRGAVLWGNTTPSPTKVEKVGKDFPHFGKLTFPGGGDEQQRPRFPGQTSAAHWEAVAQQRALVGPIPLDQTH